MPAIVERLGRRIIEEWKMKGMKEGKADGRKEQQKQIGPTLFPRLHVAETKRVGPRAPPRNKMALYEQFTIPSHRFISSPVPLPSSGRTAMAPSVSPIYQPQVQVQVQAGTFDSRYPYGPMSYMNPINSGMAYMPTLNVGQYGYVGQASVNGSSSSSTVVDGATELQRVPLVGESLVQVLRPSSHLNQSMPNTRGKDEDDFIVPIYSSATQGSSHRRPTLSAASGGLRSSQKDGDFGKDKRIHAEGATVSHRRNEKERTADDMSVEQNDDMCWAAGSSECVTASVNEHNGRNQEFSHGDHVTGQREHAMNQREMDMSQTEQDKFQRDNVCQSNGDVQQDSQPTLAGYPKEGDKLRERLEHNDHSSESSENKSEEVSEHSQARRGTSDETESSMLDNLPLVIISPRDVMDAIGQQDFWKARKDILRQQKMFSVQVFELHRILGVQKQIALSPDLMTDDIEVEEEEEDAEVPLPSTPPTLLAEVPAETNMSKPSNIGRPPVVEPTPPPIYPVPLPPQQGFLPVHPWQASPYGINPWTARMGSPYMYVPYPSPYPPAGYGVYPLMGSDVAMYERSEGIPGTTFPVWQPPGISQSWGARDSAAAAAAWYGATQGPVMGPTETRVAETARGHARVDSSGATSQVQRTTLADDTGRQGGGCLTVGGRTQKPTVMESFGWAKGWGRTAGRWERRDRGMLRSRERDMQPEACNVEGRGSADERGQQSMDCGDRRGEGAAESGEHAEETPEGELGQGLLGGTRRGGALQERTINRPLVAAESDALPLFPVLSAPVRSMQQCGVIKVVPRAFSAAPESAAGKLLSIQKERQQ